MSYRIMSAVLLFGLLTNACATKEQEFASSDEAETQAGQETPLVSYAITCDGRNCRMEESSPTFPTGNPPSKAEGVVMQPEALVALAKIASEMDYIEGNGDDNADNVKLLDLSRREPQNFFRVMLIAVGKQPGNGNDRSGSSEIKQSSSAGTGPTINRGEIRDYNQAVTNRLLREARGSNANTNRGFPR